MKDRRGDESLGDIENQLKETGAAIGRAIPGKSTATELGSSPPGWPIAPGKLSVAAMLPAAAAQPVHRKPSGSNVTDNAKVELARAASQTGSPLPASLRAELEAALGSSLAAVRIHTGSVADGAAKAVGARAYAQGQDVYFSEGAYDPSSPSGRELIAHEVAHTVQAGGPAVSRSAVAVSEPTDHHEVEADAFARAFSFGGARAASSERPTSHAPGSSIHRRREVAADQVPAQDLTFEQLAHRFAYMQSLSSSAADDLRQLGFTGAQFYDGRRDFRMLTVEPAPPSDEETRPQPQAGQGGQDEARAGSPPDAARQETPRQPDRLPVISFQGTNMESATDWNDNFNPQGVGMGQFSDNEALIVAKAQRLGGRVDVTGHSLGGTLAQIFAALYPAMVRQVITFQAPGISSELVDQMRSSREGRAVTSRHHIVDGDVPEQVGEAHTPGTAYHHHPRVDMAAANDREGAYPSHTSYPLAEESAARHAHTPGVEIPEDAGRMLYQGTVTEESASELGHPLEGSRDAIAGNQASTVTGQSSAVWQEIRALARPGRTRFADLERRIADANVSANDRVVLRANLVQLFPELQAAGQIESEQRVPGTGDEFAAMIEERLGGLTGEQRARIDTYYRGISLGRQSGPPTANRNPPLRHDSGTAASNLRERGLIQRRSDGEISSARTAAAHEAAAGGVASAGTQLPHHEAVQRAFGHHDVSGVRAHVGGAAKAASEALSASAYALGDDIAFSSNPSLHTAAHEAAHVIQQRSGLSLPGGLGERGDPHEQHADAVADLVVAGRSAETELDRYGPSPESKVRGDRGLQREWDSNPAAASGRDAVHAAIRSAQEDSELLAIIAALEAARGNGRGGLTPVDVPRVGRFNVSAIDLPLLIGEAQRARSPASRTDTDRSAATAVVSAAISQLTDASNLNAVASQLDRIGLDGDPNSTHTLTIDQVGVQYQIRRVQVSDLRRVVDARMQALDEQRRDREADLVPPPLSELPRAPASTPAPARTSPEFRTIATVHTPTFHTSIGSSANIVSGSVEISGIFEVGSPVAANESAVEGGRERSEGATAGLEANVETGNPSQNENTISIEETGWITNHVGALLGLSTNRPIADHAELNGRGEGSIGLEVDLGRCGWFTRTVRFNFLQTSRGASGFEVHLAQTEFHAEVHTPAFQFTVPIVNRRIPFRFGGEVVFEIHVNPIPFFAWLARAEAAAAAAAADTAVVIAGESGAATEGAGATEALAAAGEVAAVDIAAVAIGAGLVALAVYGLYTTATNPQPFDVEARYLEGRVDHFSLAYLRVMRGLDAGDLGAAGEQGAIAARQRIAALEAQGQSAESIRETAAGMTDLYDRVYDTVLPLFLENARDSLRQRGFAGQIETYERVVRGTRGMGPAQRQRAGL